MLRLAHLRTRRRHRGAMAAELALLVAFVYVPLILGIIYVSWLTTARQRVHESDHYALTIEGDQSQSLGATGEVSQAVFREFPGDVAVAETDADQPDIPAPNELRDLFEQFTQLIHYSNTSAHGSFYLDGSTVRYRESVQVDEGYRMRPEGQLVESWNLLDDQIPERITALLVDYMRRRRAHTDYVHRWDNDRDPVVAGDERVAGWNLKVPMDGVAARDLGQEGRLGWHPEAAIRCWTKSRMARDQTPPGATQRSDVGCPLSMPQGEPSSDFWHPVAGTTDPGGGDPPPPTPGRP
jgi:Flp pilus assembly protein TadG